MKLSVMVSGATRKITSNEDLTEKEIVSLLKSFWSQRVRSSQSIPHPKALRELALSIIHRLVNEEDRAIVPAIVLLGLCPPTLPTALPLCEFDEQRYAKWLLATHVAGHVPQEIKRIVSLTTTLGQAPLPYGTRVIAVGLNDLKPNNVLEKSTVITGDIVGYNRDTVTLIPLSSNDISVTDETETSKCLLHAVDVKGSYIDLYVETNRRIKPRSEVILSCSNRQQRVEVVSADMAKAKLRLDVNCTPEKEGLLTKTRLHPFYPIRVLGNCDLYLRDNSPIQVSEELANHRYTVV